MSAAPPPIGSLRQRVTLSRRDQSIGPDGGHLTAWIGLGDVWARVRALSVRLTESGDGRAAGATHEITLRFRADLKPGDRISFEGIAYEILAAEDLNGRRAYTLCTCTSTTMTG